MTWTKKHGYKSHWTEEEDAMLYEGKIPEGRTMFGAKARSWALGIKLFGANMKRRMTDEQIALVKLHIVPNGKTVRQCVAWLAWHGFKSGGKRRQWKMQGRYSTHSLKFIQQMEKDSAAKK